MAADGDDLASLLDSALEEFDKADSVPAAAPAAPATSGAAGAAAPGVRASRPDHGGSQPLAVPAAAAGAAAVAAPPARGAVVPQTAAPASEAELVAMLEEYLDTPEGAALMAETPAGGPTRAEIVEQMKQIFLITKQMEAGVGPAAAGAAPEPVGSPAWLSKAGRRPEDGAAGASAGGGGDAIAELLRSVESSRGGASGRGGAGAGPSPAGFDGSGSEAELFAKFMADVGQQGAGGDSPLDEAQMLEAMMEGLMAKEVLYEPLQNLTSRYPPWLAANRASTPPDQIRTYERQLEALQRVLALLDTPNHPASEVMRLMNEVQALGPPPPSIVQDMNPGAAAGMAGPEPPMPDECKQM